MRNGPRKFPTFVAKFVFIVVCSIFYHVKVDRSKTVLALDAGKSKGEIGYQMYVDNSWMNLCT